MSEIEERFALHLKAMKIEGWVREYKFNSGNLRYRFDFAWVDEMLSVEIEGGVNMYVTRKSDGKRIRVSGKHTSEKGFERDCIKYNEAMLLGWKVLRVTGKQVKSGKALEWVERMLEDK